MSSATQGKAHRIRAGLATGQRIALRDLRGSPVILVFYPAD